MEDIKIRSLRDRQKEKLILSENLAGKKSPEPEDKEIPIVADKKKSVAKKLSKLVVLVVSVFLIGGLGGVWLDRVFLPNLLVRYPAFNQYEYLKRMNERTTIIHETEEVKITQEEGTTQAIERVRPSVAEILAKGADGQFAKIGTGIILTSDGYLITPLKNIYAGTTVNTEIQVKLKSGDIYTAKIISPDTNHGLAILRMEKRLSDQLSANNLPVIPYADSDSMKLGDKLILVDDAIVTDIISRTIDNYIMPGSTDSKTQKRILIVQNLGQTSSGAAVINVEGKLVGVAQEANLIIPISEIKDYINKAITK